MAPVGARGKLWMTLGVVALAVGTAPRAAPQPDASPPTSYEQRLLAEIRAEQARSGPYSPELIDSLTTLSQFYRGTGNELAVVAEEQALGVVRATRGLSSLDQAPLLRDLIDYDEARGDYASASDREHALLKLAAKNRDDLRTIPIYREIADKRMSLLGRYAAGEFPKQLLYGCSGKMPAYQSIVSACQYGSREAIAFSMLQDAWTNYWRAIDLLRAHGLYSSDELRELETQIVRSAYKYCGSRQSRSLAAYREYCAEVGRRSYERLFDYARRTDQPADRVLIAVELADWDLLFSGGYGSALDIYAAAYTDLKEHGADGISNEGLFAPPLPVVLPAFLPNPLASQATRHSTGHIDVAFEIDRVGNARHVRVLDTTTSASDDARRRLVKTIETSRFRPRVTNGEFTRTSPVALRYFVSE